MKKKICVVTATRAEYGLLKGIIEKLQMVSEIEVKIVATGAHLSPEFGMTYQEIEKDGFKIDKRTEILLSSDTPSSISKSMGLAMISFGEYFEEEKPDLLLVLGDRYETLAVCCCAMNSRIPIAHIHGGETTEGAIDEVIRHAITKLSYLHFTSTENYRKRVIQLGEHPDRVFYVGAMGVENAKHIPLLSKEKLEELIKFPLNKPYAVVTFHPVTLENNTSKEQVKELLWALDSFPDMKFIITKANADMDGRIINKTLDEYVQKRVNAILVDSLGTTGYLSAIKYADMVIGNSSSGLIEAPSFHVATVNIGERQKGRIQAESIISCKTVGTDIKKAMDIAISSEFRQQVSLCSNPYGDGETSAKIVAVIKEYLFKEKINLKKSFFDVEWELC